MTDTWKNKLYFGDNLGIMREHIPDFNKSAFLGAFWAVLCGGFIYLLWRPDTIRFFIWMEIVGLSAPVKLIRSYGEHFYPFIPEWIVFSLPNGLWAFSYALIISHIWVGRDSNLKYFWLISVPVVGLGYETLQYLEVISGTFCYQDLLLCIVGISLGTITALLIEMRAQK